MEFRFGHDEFEVLPVRHPDRGQDSGRQVSCGERFENHQRGHNYYISYIIVVLLL